ncbi:histidine phosphatase family protein [Sphingomonas sp. JC676]|uniref:histidine phosphatase family protein n=1 Tax=Sphingomonas sp. JC676 TaxID=2768065 RepID=UPI00165855BF|nr:histidine phosphatase family protein [Sphingomonas sp. JC676]MBC9033869.1 histidine phosphatase family protein [Sphingomonas sp. JC676]
MSGSEAARWPERLWLVRHGQSAGNVARDAAHAAGLERIPLDTRDVDVPLSVLGERQADALGRWFAEGRGNGRPDVILSSPYARSRETARRFRDAGGAEPDEPVCIDERLREKEFGILDGLTTAGVAAQLPQQAEFRRLLGKFYHRPPGGESWCDVILRLRSLLDTVSLHYGGRRVMIVGHQVVVLCMRTIIENLSEEEILAIDEQGDVANCSVTEYRFDASKGKDGGLDLLRYNEVAPIEEDAVAEVTSAPDTLVAARG